MKRDPLIKNPTVCSAEDLNIGDKVVIRCKHPRTNRFRTVKATFFSAEWMPNSLRMTFEFDGYFTTLSYNFGQRITLA